MWKVEEYDNNVSERGIRVLDAEGRVVCSNEPYYPTAITAEHAATIVAAVNGRAELLAALKALELQALQSNVNSPANEWGREALALARAAIISAEAQP